MTANNPQIQKYMIEIYQEIKKTVDESYQNKNFQHVISKVPSTHLCYQAVESFIGSATQPRNEEAMKILLNRAKLNSKSLYEENEVQYFELYLNKLGSIQKGEKQGYNEANDKLLELSQKEFPLAMHIIAKEMYKVALNMQNQKEKKQKKEMIQQAAELFNKAAAQGISQSFFYLGDMAEQGDLPGGFDLKYAYECFLIAAQEDFPQAYFKLSRYHKEGKAVEKSKELEYHYCKKAAELGVVEAAHNLGCMYLEKEVVKYDSLKALAWFSHASAQNFVHSTFNLATLFMEGGKDGKVKQNYEAALTYLEQVDKSGEINVDNLIKQCIKEIELQE